MPSRQKKIRHRGGGKNQIRKKKIKIHQKFKLNSTINLAKINARMILARSVASAFVSSSSIGFNRKTMFEVLGHLSTGVNLNLKLIDEFI